MRVFYGVHPISSDLAVALDLVRYFAEPDNLRSSHITLRGPYSKPLSNRAVDHLNSGKDRKWSVRLAGPGYFFEYNQSTVFIRVELLDLSDLFYKPDFKTGVAHVTLYDGRDRGFAQALLGQLYAYDFQEILGVSKLERLPAKAPTAGNFIALHAPFYAAYCKYLGFKASAAYANALNSRERLSVINQVLDDNFAQHFQRLRPRLKADDQKNLELDFGIDD